MKHTFISLAILTWISCTNVSLGQENPNFQTDISPEANPWTHLDFYDDPMNFKFAIVTDRTGGLRSGVFKQAAEKLNFLMPEFVMSVGDFISGVTEDRAQMDKEWEDFEAELGPLKVPFFFVPGNHDISNDEMRKYWNEKFGKAYFHFVYKDVLFLMLDSNPENALTIDEKQVNFVKEKLAEHQDVRWTLLFLHHPLWMYGEYAGGFTEVENLLEGRQHTVIAGHIHHYMYMERNNANYYTLATTGGGSQLRGPRFGEFDHVTLVTMTDEGPILANLTLDGILPHNITTPEDYALTRTLIQSTQFESIVLTPDKSTYREAMVYLTFNNPSDQPLTLDAKFFHDHAFEPTPSSFSFTLAPNSRKTVSAKLDTEKNIPPNMQAPIQLDWTMGYEFEDKEDLLLSGTTEISLLPTEYDIIQTVRPLFTDQVEIELAAPSEDYTIHYTLDGSNPTSSSPVYNKPIEIAESTTLNTRMIQGEKFTSASDSKTYTKVAQGTGLQYSYYEGNWRKLPDFDTLTALYTGPIDNFSVDSIRSVMDHFAVKYEGQIQIPQKGTYEFYTTSDDGSQLYIDGKLVVDNDGDHGPMTKTGTIALSKGKHDIVVTYFENIGGQALSVEWDGPKTDRKPLSFSLLSH